MHYVRAVRLLCISDIHGDHAALSAVLATAERKGWQQLLVAGDLLFPGPEPLETFRTLSRLGATCVQGIGDRALATVDPARVEQAAADGRDKGLARRFVDVRRAVGELVLERLRRLPTHHRMPLPDGSELLLVHGAPEDPSEELSHDLDDAELTALIGDDPADVIVCGGSHVPFVREVAGVKIVNVGSVGAAPGGAVAHATFIEVDAAGVRIEPFEVPLDGRALVEHAR
jgi:predicted phosphodiesterase